MTPSTLATSLSELPEYRQVLANLIARDLKVKYESKALGFAWSLLAPACMLAILYVIFSTAFPIKMPNYWAFLVAGILPFQFLSESILTGANSIRGSAGLIRKVYVPMEIIVIAAVTVRAVEFVLQMVLAVVLLAALHRAGTMEDVPPVLAPYVSAHVHFDLLKTLIVLPGAILLSYLFVLGVSLPLSAWCVIYRDLDHVITIAMRVLFYASPVFWGVFQFWDKPWARWTAINPFTDLLALFRGPLYFGTWPFNEATGGGTLTAWGVATLFAVVALVVGYALFDRSKRILAEVV
jgi:lipopolysaccharide transport system permease protein